MKKMYGKYWNEFLRDEDAFRWRDLVASLGYGTVFDFQNGVYIVWII